MTSIEVSKVLLRDANMEDAKPLMGFDYDGGMYHVVLFDLGEDGGALGIWREGDNFCARITLDALAAFHAQAKASHVSGTA